MLNFRFLNFLYYKFLYYQISFRHANHAIRQACFFKGTG
jgi:hypothetical protein